MQQWRILQGAAQTSRKKSLALPWTVSLLIGSFGVASRPSFTSSGAVCRMIERQKLCV